METKVWLSSKKQRGGSKRYYYLRWVDPAEKVWRSQAIKVNGKPCTDKKRAQGERVKLEEKMSDGTFRQLRRSTWQEFVDEHCKLIGGDRHRDEARRILTEFGETFTGSPDRITFAAVEGFADGCKAKGNGQATINKKLRYLRAAFNKATRRGYIRKNPMDGWTWTTAKRPGIRTATADEQKALLKAAADESLPMFGFIYAALYTGGRKGELLALAWEDIDFDNRRLTFRDTKSHDDREIALTPETVGVIRGVRRNLPTVLAGGPFRTLGDVDRRWRAVRDAAGVEGVTIHDLRRTYITRLIRNGIPLPTVQRLAGHAKIQTTLEYYNATSDQDRKDAVATLRPRKLIG